ncbi:MAG: sigma-70 family RNA polymerase sigma factor [Gemmataceae bacterium]
MLKLIDSDVGPALASLPPRQALTAEELFRQHGPRIYRLARWLLGNDADAEDVAQEVFLRVVRNLPGFRGEASVTTWLNRIAVHEALAFRHRRAVCRQHEAHEPLDDFADDGRRAGRARRRRGPAAQAVEHEAHEEIERAIGRLPGPYRDVYVLADVEELSNDAVADLLGLTVAAVKSRLHRARLMMRKALTPYFEEPAA